MRSKNRSFAAIAALALLAGCATSRTQAEPPVLAQLGRGTDILMIGEIHGTSEAPAAFADLVEQASRRQRIQVGLEIQEATIAQAGCGRARPDEGSLWLSAMQDGRTSQAMRALVCRLLALQARKRITLFGFAPASQPPAGRHHLAGAIQSRATVGGTPMLLLVGNFHAQREAGTLADVLTKAGLRLVTVTVSSPGGTAFTCDGEGKCGSRPSPARFCAAEATSPTLVVGAQAGLPPELPWDGCLLLPPTTASPPV
jgi:hypothetical protein